MFFCPLVTYLYEYLTIIVTKTYFNYLPKVALIYMVGKYVESVQSIPLCFSFCTDLQLAVLRKAR